MPSFGHRIIRRFATLAAFAAIAALLSAGSTLGALINGALPAGSFTYASVMTTLWTSPGAGSPRA